MLEGADSDAVLEATGPVTELRDIEERVVMLLVNDDEELSDDNEATIVYAGG